MKEQKHIITFRASQVQAESRTIEGVILAKEGEAKGHGVWADAAFIQKTVDEIQAAEAGIKCHFGHNYNNLGKLLGRFKNARVEGDTAVADLQLYASADLSPVLEKSASYVLSMAAEDPEALMCSVVFYIGEEYQQIGDERVRVRYENEDGNWVSANPDYPVYVEMESLKYVDIVDEGALTDKLFSTGSLHARMKDLVNEEGFEEMMKKHALEFSSLGQFFSGTLTKLAKSIFGIGKEGADASTQQLAELETERDQFAAKVTELETTINQITEKRDALEKDLTAAREEATRLNARIAQLEKELEAAGAEHTDGSSNSTDSNETAGWKDHPTNKKFSHINKKPKK